MRKLYLIRHGEPAFLNKERSCIGLLDLDLTPWGQRQAALAGMYLAGRPLPFIWCSQLRRSRRTAEIIAAGGLSVSVHPGLREVAAGEWEGLTFSEIRRRWPEIYEARGRDPINVPPPGGELFVDALQRFDVAMREILACGSGDVAVVSHAGVLRLWLTQQLGRPLEEMFQLRLPYGSVVEVEIDEERTVRVCPEAVCPWNIPDRDACEIFLRQRGTAAETVAHCHAVAQLALDLLQRLPLSQRPDAALLEAAALLHDVARRQPFHAERGAEMVEAAGWPLVAQVIAGHHNLPEYDANHLTAASLLFLADKLIDGERKVSLEERFTQSRSCCQDQIALAKWRRRYEQARQIQKMLTPTIPAAKTRQA